MADIMRVNRRKRVAISDRIDAAGLIATVPAADPVTSVA